MIFGYARVSTEDQNLDAEFHTLNSAGAERVFAERISGSATKRPKPDALLDQLRASDVIVVTKYDRAAGSSLFRGMSAGANTLAYASPVEFEQTKPFAWPAGHAGTQQLSPIFRLTQGERSMPRRIVQRSMRSWGLVLDRSFKATALARFRATRFTANADAATSRVPVSARPRARKPFTRTGRWRRRSRPGSPRGLRARRQSQ